VGDVHLSIEHAAGCSATDDEVLTFVGAYRTGRVASAAPPEDDFLGGPLDGGQALSRACKRRAAPAGTSSLRMRMGWSACLAVMVGGAWPDVRRDWLRPAGLGR
jgi:hypothetical protein